MVSILLNKLHILLFRKYPIPSGQLHFSIDNVFNGTNPPYFYFFCQPQIVGSGTFKMSDQKYHMPGGFKADKTINLKHMRYTISEEVFERHDSNYHKEGIDQLMYWYTQTLENLSALRSVEGPNFSFQVRYLIKLSYKIGI